MGRGGQKEGSAGPLIEKPEETHSCTEMRAASRTSAGKKEKKEKNEQNAQISVRKGLGSKKKIKKM